MTKIQAIKAYFGRTVPVTNAELIWLRRADAKGFDELADACLKALEQTETATMS